MITSLYAQNISGESVPKPSKLITSTTDYRLGFKARRPRFEHIRQLITNLLVGVLRLGEAGGGLHDEDGDEDQGHEAGGGHGHGAEHTGTGTWRPDTESCYIIQEILQILVAFCCST